MMDSSLIPRLPTSVKWTELPADFTQSLKNVFTEQFRSETRHGEFVVQGRIYPGEIVMRVGFIEIGRLKQINFEASMDLPITLATAEEDKFGEQNLTMDRIYACSDILGSLMEEYFKLGDEAEMDVPLRWSETEFEGETIFIQHSTVNSRLEDEADRILRMAGITEDDLNLVNEMSANEDALNNAEIDTDLALEVQKVIRAGKHPLQQQSLPEADGGNEDLN